jgi:hypothetical protein
MESESSKASETPESQGHWASVHRSCGGDVVSIFSGFRVGRPGRLDALDSGVFLIWRRAAPLCHFPQD